MFTSRHVYGLFLSAVTVTWLAGCQVQGFTTTLAPPVTSTSSPHRTVIGIPKTPGSSIPGLRHMTFHHATKTNQNSDDDDEHEPTLRRFRPRYLIGKLDRLVPSRKAIGRLVPSRKAIGRLVPSRKAVLRRAKPITFAVLTALTLEFSGGGPQVGSSRGGGLSGHFRPRAAQASAPIMKMPTEQRIPPKERAYQKHREKQLQMHQEELREFNKKATEIQARQGKAARIEFEKDYEEKKLIRKEEKEKELVQLKRDLLDQGICPFVDLEGQRQVILHRDGLDLADAQGTEQWSEKQLQENMPRESNVVLKRPHRFIIKNQVEDLKRRGVDPLEHFEANQEQTKQIWNMKTKDATNMAHEYAKNLQEYGQITVPVEGEVIMSKEEYEAKAQAMDKDSEANAKAAKKAAAKAAKAEAKAKAKAEKAKAKAEARAAKELAKKEKKEAKMAAAAAASAAAAAGAAGDAAQTVGDAAAAGVEAVTSAGTETVAPSTSAAGTDGVGGKESSEAGVESEPQQDKMSRVLKGAIAKDSKKKTAGKIPLIPVASFVAAAGGGGYAFKVYREKAELSEKQRQEQVKLIMGMDKDKDDDDDDNDKGDSTGPSWSAPALEEVDTDVPDLTEFVEGASADDSEKETPSPETTQPVAEPEKKRRLGIKSMFSKKNSRGTDLNALLAPSATGPEFASLLAKILTFGAPGRFPAVMALPGGMPMETFVLEDANTKLIESRTAAGLTTEESAEVFANVVNCMLIDIVDLASATLKEKDEKVTIDAINVVIDFMNHAASLYESVAEGIVIDAVTYGGDLGKGKLEQMYSIYSMSEGEDQDRVGLLQDVFSITDKKAEGIMMKNFQKKMMEMMKNIKDGGGLEQSMEGMEGMDEESLKAMQEAMGMGGGLDGMPEPTPEETKEMLLELKKLKDSGQISKKDLQQVRKDFEKQLGVSIDEMMSKAEDEGDAMTESERELLDLMKTIMVD